MNVSYKIYSLQKGFCCKDEASVFLLPCIKSDSAEFCCDVLGHWGVIQKKYQATRRLF